MAIKYLRYTVGGWFGNGRPIEGSECASLQDARKCASYFAEGALGMKACPVIYGWVDDDSCNAVELS